MKNFCIKQSGTILFFIPPKKSNKSQTKTLTLKHPIKKYIWQFLEK
jgi:hypothetical protein